MSSQLNIVTCPAYPEKIMRDMLLHRLHQLSVHSLEGHLIIGRFAFRHKTMNPTNSISPVDSFCSF